MEKVLFDWPIVLQYDVKAKYRLILESSRAWSFFTLAFAWPTKNHARFCIRSINQSNRSISVRLFFLLCSRVWILSRSCSIWRSREKSLESRNRSIWRACSQATRHPADWFTRMCPGWEALKGSLRRDVPLNSSNPGPVWDKNHSFCYPV